MSARAAQLEEEILAELARARFPITLQDVMRNLGCDMKDAKPRNAMVRLVNSGRVDREGYKPPYRFRLSEAEAGRWAAATSACATEAPPEKSPTADPEVAEAEVAEADITEADMEMRPTDNMTSVTSEADEALADLRTRLNAAVESAASDKSAISAAQQEAITDLIHDHGPQLGAQILDTLGMQKEELVAALRTMVKAGVLTRSGGEGSPFELVQRGVMDLLTGDDVLAVCSTCSSEIARGKVTAAMVREIFSHDSSHSVRVRAASGSYSRRQLEKIDAEQQAARPTPPPPGPKADEIVTCLLPDGRNYSPRTVLGSSTPDVEALRVCRDNNSPVCLNGPPGTGKTALVLAAFADVLTINGDGDTAVADFVGTWTMSGDPAQQYVWADGPLTTAMKEGRPLFVDDFTLISGKVLSVLFPVMDGRGRIYLREHPVKSDDGSWHPEVVEARKGFWIVGAHNPGVHGAMLSPALASRFTMHLEIPSDYELAEKMGINRRAVKVARNLQVSAEANRVAWWPQLRELMAFARIESLFGEDVAVANLAGICPEEDRTEVIGELKNVFGRDFEPLRLGKQL